MTDDVKTGEAITDVEHDVEHDDEHKPVGTILIMVLLLLTIVAMWVWVYSILIGRG